MAFDWLGAGYLRRKRESPGGFASTQSGGDSVPGKPSLIPGAGSETGSDFSYEVGSCGGYWGLLLVCGMIMSPHSLRPSPFTRGHSEALVSPFLLASVDFEDVF